jgi:ribosome biogenesis GTPase
MEREMIGIKDYGYRSSDLELPEGLVPARVVAIHREVYMVVCDSGEKTANLKGSFLHQAQTANDYPAIGDFVLLKVNPAGNSSIVKVLPRFSKFSRTDFSGHSAKHVKTVLEQVVAANFDYVFIMSSLNQDFSVNRILRYLTQAWQSGGSPVVILTKADLCDQWEAQVSALQELAGDVDIIALSSQTGMGIKRLFRYLQPGKTLVFLGMSGVGKSSLLNKLAGKELMAVTEIRNDDARGRHTTTHRQLVRLPSGAMVIDTPGMRELGLWEADEGIRTSFQEVEELIASCRFSNCRHKTEPGCAVIKALDEGKLPQKVWEGYLAQKSEAAFVKQRARPQKR